MGNFDIKPEGYDKPDKIPIPTELGYARPTEKVGIKLNLSDRWNQFRGWFTNQVESMVGIAFSNLIPNWFFIALLIVIAIILWVAL